MTKVCSKCGIEKPKSEFRKDSKSKDQLGYWCKECDREYKRQYYAIHRDKVNAVRRERYNTDPEYKRKQDEANLKAYHKHKAARLEQATMYKSELQEFVDSLKTPCKKCGETRKWLIQFHHIEPEHKRFQIQSTHSKAKLLEEVKKCVCLCSSCHTEYHYFFGKKPTNPKESLETYLSEGFSHETLKRG